MCFSAEASFGASVIITTVGVVAYKKADQTPLRYIAMIPVFFGIQQFSEGFVWLANMYTQFEGVRAVSTYTFMFFAWIIWPIYIPFSFRKIETNPKKRTILFLLVLIGFCISAALSYIMIVTGVDSKIQDCSILYEYDAPHSLGWLFAALYIASVVIPTLISSIPKAWWLGVANVSLFFLTKIYYKNNVISVWCFFAAITSVLILWIILQEKKKEKIRMDKR